MKNFNNTSVWIQNSLDNNEKQYYEFEVTEDEECSRSEEEIKDDELTYMTCHICEIKVPQLYFNDHKYSSKHEINTKIAYLAMRRLQNHVNNICEINHERTKPSKYFCSTCVTVMDSSEKAHHKNSLEHKNSIIVEKFLCDFLFLYGNKSEEDRLSITPHTSCKNEFDVNVKKHNNNSKVQNEEVCTKKINTPPIGLKDYILLLKDKFKTESLKLELVDEHNLMIQTDDGSKVKIGVENFHSFKESGVDLTQCFLCQDEFLTLTKEQHITSDKHMQLLWDLPFKNKDCLRQVANSYHCGLCNFYMKDCDSHLLSSEHLKNVETCNLDENKQEHKEEVASSFISEVDNGNSEIGKHMENNHNLQCANSYLNSQKDVEANKVSVISNLKVPSPNKTNKNKNIFYFCDICKVNVPNMKYNMESHIIGRSHIKNMQKVFNKTDKIKNNGTRVIKNKKQRSIDSNCETQKIYHISKSSNSDVPKCVVCNIYIANDTSTIKSHVEESAHLLKYNNIILTNQLDIKDNGIYCNICAVHISIGNEVTHCQGKQHMEKLKMKISK